MDRAANLERLRRERFDVLVIGGGITGAGIALDAVSRGLKTALVERGDFACGTSSRSSKLIHGGLRYLKQLQFKVTIEASREKARLKRLAPHLVEDLPFLLPFWTRTARPLLGSGLWIYDAAAGFPKGLVHRHLSAREALETLPSLRPEGLRGAYLYYDARADDCRLVMHVLRKAADLGVVAANGVEVVGFLKDRDRVAGARTRDFDIAAARVVNATGVWCDDVRGGERTVRPSKGVHLVVPMKRLRLTSAAMLPSPADGRIAFLIPWGDRAIVGTTDTDYAGSLDRPRAEAEDVDYLLALVNASLPSVGLTRRDVLSTYAGLRPLLRDDAEAPSARSREHHLFEDPSGLLTITGGKLTTYRLMAREVVDRLTRRKCRTQEIDLYATEGRDALSRRYGSEAARIVDRTLIVDGLPYVWGEVDYAMEREMARGLVDVLSRRTRLALFAEDRGRSVAEPVARRMAARLGWDAKEIGRQLEAYELALDEEFPRPY
ncbi:MAG TPA: glycerol-3-phosphate dehydrogenase/oxidase [Planctomycetota bacterium]